MSCIIAKTTAEPLRFACYDDAAACRGFFGSTDVLESRRGKGTGTALLVTLRLMREVGYAYAIIGGVSPAEFYTRTVGAVLIEGSTPGTYRDML